MVTFARTRPLALAALLSAAPLSVDAQQIRFDNGWQEQRFSMFSSNEFALQGNAMSVRSDGTVSLMWTRVPEALWDSRSARWTWRVSRSVPATDLTKKGGDDRNLSLYFVFLPEAVAQAAKDEGVRALLDNPDARVLMYVWGGNHAPGQILPTPYLGPRGRTVVQRPAGTGEASETIDLARDFREAFGGEPEALVGLAVSADSDDTSTGVTAEISGLSLN